MDGKPTLQDTQAILQAANPATVMKAHKYFTGLQAVRKTVKELCETADLDVAIEGHSYLSELLAIRKRQVNVENSPLLRLPKEIRCMILKLVIGRDNKTLRFFESRTEFGPPVLHVCHLLREDAAELFFARPASMYFDNRKGELRSTRLETFPQDRSSSASASDSQHMDDDTAKGRRHHAESCLAYGTDLRTADWSMLPALPRSEEGVLGGLTRRQSRAGREGEERPGQMQERERTVKARPDS